MYDSLKNAVATTGVTAVVDPSMGDLRIIIILTFNLITAVVIKWLDNYIKRCNEAAKN